MSGRLEEYQSSGFLPCKLDNTIYISTCDRALPSEEKLEEFKEDDALCISNMNCRLYKVTESHQLQYVLIVWGNAEAASTIGELAVCQIESLLTAYMEKSDKKRIYAESSPWLLF